MEKYEFTDSERALLESMEEPFAIYQFVDKHVVTSILSNGFCKLFGYDDRARAYYDMDNNMYKNTHPDDVSRIANAAIKFAVEGGEYDVLYRSRREGEEKYHIIHAHGEHSFTDDGFRLAHVWYTDEGEYDESAAFDEILEGRLASEKLEDDISSHMSRYDFLTGLPNMTYFFELADAGRSAIGEKGHCAVMLFVDLSGMKFFNVKYTFAEGDRLIKTFADLLKRLFGSENCCHIGGDHFAVFTAEDGLEDRLKDLFAEWKSLSKGHFLPVRVGIYSEKLESVKISTECNRAKFACDELRGTFESGFNYYHQDMRDVALKHQYVLENFDRALDEKWIKVHYQPIVRAITGRVCDEEALSRWIDPERGTLYPDEFIPVLEETRLIYRMDLYVLEQILEKIKIQEKYGIDVVPTSVNLSRSDFETCDIVEEVRSRVDAAGIDRGMITIEITESIIGNDFDYMKEQVERFRSLGFQVWMDDFGSGYSSLDVLQSIKFDLIKFDMNFLKKMDKGSNGKIIMKELMKMATSIGVDTVCEGVETEEQVEFLRDIGCSKLQGFYFSKPVNFSDMVEGFRKGICFGYEDREELDYYASIGRVDLSSLAVIASREMEDMQNVFDNIPMAVVEYQNGRLAFIRSNEEYRSFVYRVFGVDLSDSVREIQTIYLKEDAPFMRLIQNCRGSSASAFYDHPLMDGSVVHYFARRISSDPVRGRYAVAVAVLSVTDADEGTTYAEIARALASDYNNLYYIDLDTEEFIEYSSVAGKEEIAEERHGEHFFASARRDAKQVIYEEDLDSFLAVFNRENIIKQLNDTGAFTLTYRQIDAGVPVYMNMKITRMPGGNHIIIGVSTVDAQMKQKELLEKTQKERDTLARIMTLDEGYLSLYSVDPETGQYFEYGSSDDFGTLGIAKKGDDFFEDTRVRSEGLIHPDDEAQYMKMITRDSIMKMIRERGAYTYSYRLLINGKYRPVSLRIAYLKESDGEKLVAGIREWRDRKNSMSFEEYCKQQSEAGKTE